MSVCRGARAPRQGSPAALASATAARNVSRSPTRLASTSTSRRSAPRFARSSRPRCACAIRLIGRVGIARRISSARAEPAGSASCCAHASLPSSRSTARATSAAGRVSKAGGDVTVRPAAHRRRQALSRSARRTGRPRPRAVSAQGALAQCTPSGASAAPSSPWARTTGRPGRSASLSQAAPCAGKGASMKGAPGGNAAAPAAIRRWRAASRRSCVGRESRPGIDEARAKGAVPRQRQRRIAQHALSGRAGRDEIRGAGRVQNVLVGRLDALAVIAVDQRDRARPLTTSASFQPRLSASWMPELAPRAPKGET